MLNDLTYDFHEYEMTLKVSDVLAHGVARIWWNGMSCHVDDTTLLPPRMFFYYFISVDWAIFWY